MEDGALFEEIAVVDVVGLQAMADAHLGHDATVSNTLFDDGAHGRQVGDVVIIWHPLVAADAVDLLLQLALPVRVLHHQDQEHQEVVVGRARPAVDHGLKRMDRLLVRDGVVSSLQQKVLVDGLHGRAILDGFFHLAAEGPHLRDVVVPKPFHCPQAGHDPPRQMP